VGEQHRDPGRGEVMRRRRSGGPAADHQHVKALHDLRLQCAALPGVCPSGQRERAVNPSAQPTEVRILPPPLTRRVVLRRQYRGAGLAEITPAPARAPSKAVIALVALVLTSVVVRVLVAWRHTIPRLFPDEYIY